MGCGLSTAPLLPGGRQRLVLPCRRVSATSSLDLSPRVRDRCADNLAMQRKLGELRRESYIILWVIRSTMKIVTLSLSSLSLSFGCATCNMWSVSGPVNVRYAMTLVMSCRCLSQSYVDRSIGGECVLSVDVGAPSHSSDSRSVLLQSKSVSSNLFDASSGCRVLCSSRILVGQTNRRTDRWTQKSCNSPDKGWLVIKI